MAIVPHVSPARWRARIYPGDLAHTGTVRADLRADLAGFPEDLVEAAVLCASEIAANAVEHTRSGDPDGRVLRALFVSEPGVLRLTVVDDGARESSPEIPLDRTPQEWLTAERGRGLLMVAALARAWGSYPIVPLPFCSGLGTAVWAEFPLPPNGDGR
ncbi:Anti-sigma regulatory factor (Ser/Thr protein kinase) [Nocardiopsis flavescens]|uniref:Anti-sigma regulatory factor (Ser/Thr protein kinase) n=1 Tax=Nocardiopsis flavescens TaxID=758803 RepID=A0A1M6QFF3_9ACTN|nr:ATP-binding protein [Nocardiopsis flavescens]SHK19034.1 Anti-sigma regulatory factor (Ser/Thr protein kinase) [Nocardiopsis flavescens]